MTPPLLRRTWSLLQGTGRAPRCTRLPPDHAAGARRNHQVLQTHHTGGARIEQVANHGTAAVARRESADAVAARGAAERIRDRLASYVWQLDLAALGDGAKGRVRRTAARRVSEA